MLAKTAFWRVPSNEIFLSVQALRSTISRGYADEAVALGINIKKGGTDPLLKPIEEYPEWVQSLTAPKESLYDLRRKIAGSGEESLDLLEAARVVKLENRAAVRANNALKAKK